ncbi:hypothetical protein SLA2020_219740 [Shorea laevis]
MWVKPNNQQVAQSQQKDGGPNVKFQVCEKTGSNKQDQLVEQQGSIFHVKKLLAKKGKEQEGSQGEGSKSFSTDLGNEEGNGIERRDLSRKEGSALRSKTDKKKKRKKAKMCGSVYQRASILGFMRHRKKNKSGAK